VFRRSVASALGGPSPRPPRNATSHARCLSRFWISGVFLVNVAFITVVALVLEIIMCASMGYTGEVDTGYHRSYMYNASRKLHFAASIGRHVLRSSWCSCHILPFAISSKHFAEWAEESAYRSAFLASYVGGIHFACLCNACILQTIGPCSQVCVGASRVVFGMGRDLFAWTFSNPLR